MLIMDIERNLQTVTKTGTLKCSFSFTEC